MKTNTLQKAIKLAQRTGSVFVATCSAGAMPHIASAGRIELANEASVAVTEWFCPGTVANLHANSCVAIVVWDAQADNGYQLLGRLEKIEDKGILDGYAPAIESKGPMPQVQKRLVVRVERILEFKLGPHSDVED